MRQAIPILSLCLLVLWFCPGWASNGDRNDLLMLPAVATKHLASTSMMDLTLAGNRLVTVGNAGRIGLSDDNGKTWTQAEVPVSVTLTAVTFPTPEQGWAVGHDGVILHSGDGGRSWHKQLDGNQINELVLDQIEDLLAQTRNMLRSAPETTRGELETRLEDLDFFRKDAKMAIREGATRPFMDLWFKNEREGIVVGAFGLIFRTEDGGVHWQPLLDRMDNPDGYHYYAIARAGNSLFIAGEVGMLFRSDDDGNSWERLETPYEGSFFTIYGAESGASILVCGLGGNGIVSRDGGTAWSMVDKPKTSALSAAATTRDDNILLIAYDGTTLLSTDQGRSFNPLPGHYPGTIAMQSLNNGNILLAGLNGIKQWAGVEQK